MVVLCFVLTPGLVELSHLSTRCIQGDRDISPKSRNLHCVQATSWGLSVDGTSSLSQGLKAQIPLNLSL